MQHFDEKEVHQPCEHLAQGTKTFKYAVIILNRAINFKFPPTFLLNLWNQAAIRITVDGGTERWLSWLKLHDIQENEVSPPDLITGDMDSLSTEVLDYFIRSGSSKVVRTPDQNETDFTKALKQLNKHSDNIEEVYVIADCSGRFDQIIANVNTLYKSRNIVPKSKVFLVAPDSLTWLLNEGMHVINIPVILRENHEWCALIPMGSSCCVTTTGLKWNLENSRLAFGDCVSTSNTYSGEPTVTVQTDNAIVWSMGIKPLNLGV